jgi:hypothetical protein
VVYWIHDDALVLAVEIGHLREKRDASFLKTDRGLKSSQRDRLRSSGAGASGKNLGQWRSLSSETAKARSG